MNKNIISIILTTKNEILFIDKCVRSILSQNTDDKYEIEIIIVDGLSNDGTADAVRSLSEEVDRLILVENHEINQASGFNLGISCAKGAWIAWFGAHSEYPQNYLLGLYNSSIRANADYTGGSINTIPHNTSYSASLVQAITTHKFGVGNSGFRTTAKEGPADTASFGLYKAQVFEIIGKFDQRLVRGQDFEFNSRIRKSGGLVWINPDLVVNYTNQPNLYLFLKKQFMKEAPYNAYMWYLAPYTFAYRHAITGVFAAGIIIGGILSFYFPVIRTIYFGVAALYFILACGSAIQQAYRYKKPLHILFLPFSFFSYHLFHGLGILMGIVKILLGMSPVQKVNEPWGGYGSYRVQVNKTISED